MQTRVSAPHPPSPGDPTGRDALLLFQNLALFFSLLFPPTSQMKNFRNLLCAFLALAVLCPARNYAAPGDLDLTFNTTGKVTTPIGTDTDSASGVAVQSDGKIVVAGSSVVAGSYGFALARYNADGTLDTTFGTAGKVTTAIGPASGLGRDLAIQADGKIVVVGRANNGTDDDFAVARYNSNGTLDTTFGTGGIVMTPIGTNEEAAESVVVQSDGAVVVAGFTWNGSNNDFALVRYTSTGALDSTFGTGGKVTTPVGASSDLAFSVTLQSDGHRD